MAIAPWSWLGDDLALDFVNTVRRRGAHYVELIAGPADLAEWLAREADRVPAVAAVDTALVRRFLELRDPALRLLRAAAAGPELPADERAALNRSARRYPAVRLVGDYPGVGRAEPVTAGDREGLLATLTAAVVDLLTRPDITDLALCDAPGCGQLYLRGRPNQRWCGPGCGARARSERHHRPAAERAPAGRARAAGRLRGRARGSA